MNERDVFIEALQKGSRAQLMEYLDEACGDDKTLRHNVEALLDAHTRAGRFLEEPVMIPVAEDGSNPLTLALRIAGEYLEQETPGEALSFPDGSLEARGKATVDAKLMSLGFIQAPLEPGELARLGPYRLLRLLGEGGMGIVFLAEDTQLEREVALKLMRPELAVNPVNRERFLREGRAAARLRSSHVVHIYHVDQVNGLPYLVMEVLRGQSLSDALEQNGRFPLGQCLRIARDVAEGLAVAHAAGLMHRDIKPGNIWLEEPNGNVKLLDFGLARAFSGPLITQHHVILGTPAYMSPEQAAGQPLDERCDLFSLGAVLYQMLTGQRPFPGNDLIVVLTNLAKAAIPPAASLVPGGLPASLAFLLDRLLATDPSSRPASANEVVSALAAVEKELAGAAPSHAQSALTANHVNTGTDSDPLFRKRRRGILLIALISLVFGPFLAVLALRDRSEIDQKKPDPEAIALPETTVSSTPAVAPMPREAPLAREFALFGHGHQVQAMAFTSDSKTLVSADYEGLVLHWDMKQRQITFQMAVTEFGQLQTIAIDNDSRWLAMGLMSRDILLYRLGKAIRMGALEGHTDRITQLVFLKDGNTLLSTGFDGSIRRWNVQNRKEGQLLRASGPRIDSLNVWEESSGNLRLAIGGPQFVKLDDKVLEQFPYSPGRVVFSHDGRMVACSKQDRVVKPKDSYVALWQVSDKVPLGELSEAPLAQGLAFTPDNKYIVVIGTRYDIGIVYSVSTRQKVARIEIPQSAISLAISPDGRWLAIGTLKGPIYVWDLPYLIGSW